MTSTADTSRGTQLTALRPRERRAVAAWVKSHRVHCPRCHSRSFDVGDALYLGFLFVNAELDEWVVALTCRNPHCPAPRTGVKLREQDFR